VIEKGALAGLIVVAGDPTQDLGLFDDPSANLKVIMKDGVFHKNPLPQ
jgi:imidazolonepropionase-like amidohydrolase